MTPLVLGLGMPELLIVLAVALLLFGGSRLAGLGKSSGRAIREFKEETRSLSESDKTPDREPAPPSAINGVTHQPPAVETAVNRTGESRRDT